MNQTMERMAKLSESDGSDLVQVLFGLKKPTPLPPDLEDVERGAGKVDFIDATLNDSQRDAVRFALASREVALIHGPPGVSLYSFRLLRLL
jgi:DNA polymerase alpha-associated DNA helicase A